MFDNNKDELLLLCSHPCKQSETWISVLKIRRHVMSTLNADIVTRSTCPIVWRVCSLTTLWH